MLESGLPRRISGTKGSSGEFEVPSVTVAGRNYYPRVRAVAERLSTFCPCPGFRFVRGRCRHVAVVEAMVRDERLARAQAVGVRQARSA